MFVKADGSWWPCGDFYPLPNMMDFQYWMQGCHVFSKVDHQIPMNKEGISKSAITIPFELFDYMWMTFSMWNAGSTFHWVMDCVVNGHPGYTYMDNILVGSWDMEVHRRDLWDLF